LYGRSERSLGRVIDARYAAMMNEMMQQTLTIGTAKHASLPGWPAGGKTGTSQDFRDAWFIGYTAHLVTAVWLGNDDGAPTKHVTGGGLPVQVWSRFMRGAHQNVPVAALPGYGGGSGFLSGLFGGNGASIAPARTASTDGAAPRPPADIGAAPARSSGSAGLDGWLLNNFFSRR
jgi:penicillin-binding protein 1A